MLSLPDLTGASPTIWSIGSRLYARAPFVLRLASLFSYDRLLKVDRAAREVTIRSQWFWAFRNEKTFPFSRIRYIDFDYSSLSLGSERDFQSVDILEKYKVSLVLEKPYETVELFRFSGDTITVHDQTPLGVPGAIPQLHLGLGSGRNPREAARRFIDLLAGMMDVPVGPPARHFAAVDGTKYYCSECGRGAGPASTQCVYCGGALDAVVEVASGAGKDECESGGQ